MCGIDRYYVIATIATQVLHTLCKYSAVCGAYASHTWIKPNNVNTNYNGYNTHRRTMYDVNRNVRLNPTSW